MVYYVITKAVPGGERAFNPDTWGFDSPYGLYLGDEIMN